MATTIAELEGPDPHGLFDRLRAREPASWVPAIETILVENDELAPQGGGEPAIVPIGAVLANAVFDATGARLYRLPMTPVRVRRAIAA